MDFEAVLEEVMEIEKEICVLRDKNQAWRKEFVDKLTDEDKLYSTCTGDVLSHMWVVFYDDVYHDNKEDLQYMFAIVPNVAYCRISQGQIHLSGINFTTKEIRMKRESGMMMRKFQGDDYNIARVPEFSPNEDGRRLEQMERELKKKYEMLDSILRKPVGE